MWIGRDEVHVWLASLRVSETVLERLGRALAPEERARAARFHRESLRRSYTAAHGILRDILGRYLRRDPATLQLGHTPRGKPFLLDECDDDSLDSAPNESVRGPRDRCRKDQPSDPGSDLRESDPGPWFEGRRHHPRARPPARVGRPLPRTGGQPQSGVMDGPDRRLDLRFNLSHSGDLALYAVASGRSVGVDLEQIRGPIEYDQIALRCFTARELADLRSAPPASQARVFFACWTRIEAYVKARGEGLASVWGRGAASAAGATAAPDETELSGWTVRELPAPPGYAAALAAEGAGAVLRCWYWREPAGGPPGKPRSGG